MWSKQCHKLPITGNGKFIPPTKNRDFSGGWCKWHCFNPIIYIEEIDIGILASHTSFFFIPKWEVHLHSIGLKLKKTDRQWLCRLGGFWFFVVVENFPGFFHPSCTCDQYWIHNCCFQWIWHTFCIVDELTFCWLYIVIISTIWLFNIGKSPFLIGKASISMGHLYHGYVK